MPATEAQKKANKKWRETNKEYYNELSNFHTKEWYHKNKETVLAKKKEWYEKNKEIVKQKALERYYLKKESNKTDLIIE
jgi:hypothetical protein